VTHMNKVSTKVRDAGVVGAGGAGFPTHVKLDARAEIVIVNGAECEPLLRTDQQLMAMFPDLLVKGLAYAMQATGAKQGIIALKAKYQDAISALKPVLKSGMRIEILRDIYPAGDEVITIWLTTGRRVPPGGIPLNIGVVVSNVQSLMNVARAMDGEPVTSRTLTVTGIVPSPVTVTVPIGTSLSEVLSLAGGPVPGAAYINGGPLMGNLCTDLTAPVTKTTGGLIALPDDHPLIRRKQADLSSVMRIARTVCEQCSNCTENCPRHIIGHRLSPHLIVRAANYNNIGDPELLTDALICSECGLCEAYSCPVGISPRRINAALKSALRARGVKYQGKLGKEDPLADNRLIPSIRVAQRMGIGPWYHQDAPLSTDSYQPGTVVLPLKQHVGAPAVPVVKQGDHVVRGALVGEIPEGALGARVHASIDGVVVSVTPEAITVRKDGGNQ
jgi:Na+-translocating ferredoxin:NAD+ oxidoreductase RnfC subunit